MKYVEKQGRLSRAAQPGKNNQFPRTNLKVNAFEVVVSCSAKKYAWGAILLHLIGLSTEKAMARKLLGKWRPVGDSNPCCRDENPVSWTWLDERDNKRAIVFKKSAFRKCKLSWNDIPQGLTLVTDDLFYSIFQMKPTYNPSKLRRARKFGFRKRNQTSAGRKVLSNRRRKGRARLSASVARRFR